MEKTEDRKREDNWWRMKETGNKNRYYEAGEKKSPKPSCFTFPLHECPS